MINKIFKSLVVILFIGVFSLVTSLVFADDDENDYEDRNYKPIEDVQPTIVPSAPIITPVSVPRTTVVETPIVSTQINLKDSDKDGIIDILDNYPGEDDFAFNIKDVNNNGIADDLEYLIFKED